MDQVIAMLNLTQEVPSEVPVGLKVTGDTCPSPCENCNCTW